MEEKITKMIDESIELDITNFPKSVKEEIKELEKLNENEDWFSYDLKFDELEMNAKSYLLSGVISEYEFKKILEKYGRLYDWNKKFKWM